MQRVSWTCLRGNSFPGSADLGVFWLGKMWTCPKCRTELVQKNLAHSCGNYTTEDFLRGSSPRSVELFWIFVEAWKKIGEVKLHPVKTSVSIMNKVRFARVNRIKQDSIVCHLWLKQKVESAKFFRIDQLGASDFIHHFEIADESFIDDELVRYMKMAFELGERADRRSR